MQALHRAPDHSLLISGTVLKMQCCPFTFSGIPSVPPSKISADFCSSWSWACLRFSRCHSLHHAAAASHSSFSDLANLARRTQQTTWLSVTHPVNYMRACATPLMLLQRQNWCECSLILKSWCACANMLLRCPNASWHGTSDCIFSESLVCLF